MKVICIIPGIKEEKNSMPFCKRQIQTLRMKGIDIHDFYLTSRTNPFILLKELVKIYKETKDIKRGIIHAHYGTTTAFFSMFLSLLKGLPLIITFRGSDLNKTAYADGFWTDLFGRILSNISVLKAAKIICVAENLKHNLWWNKGKVEILPSGVNTSLFRPIDTKEARVKLGWGINEKVILFYAGKNRSVKNEGMAKNVFLQVKKKLPNVRLKVLEGDIPYERVPLYMNASDCLLVTSYSEGSPGIVKEALACNLPVVSVDVGDVAQRLRGVSPSAVVSRDIKELSDTVQQILLLKRRSNGRSFIQDLSEEEIAQKIINLYKSVR